MKYAANRTFPTLVSVLLTASFGALVFLAQISDADAKCGIRPTYGLVSPESGTILSRPLVWLFTQAEEVDIDVWSKHENVATVTRFPTDGVFTAWKVDVEFKGDSPRFAFDVRLSTTGAAVFDGDDEAESPVRESSYVFDPQLDRKAGGPVELTGLRSFSSNFICAREHYIAAQPSIEAPAYRIEWAETLAEYQAGKRKTMVLPALRWDYDQAGEQELMFGAMGCWGETFWADLSKGVYVGVAALHVGNEALGAPILLRHQPGHDSRGHQKFVEPVFRKTLPLGLLLGLFGFGAVLGFASIVCFRGCLKLRSDRRVRHRPNK